MCEYCEGEDLRSIIEVRLDNEQTDVFVDYNPSLSGRFTLAIETVLWDASTWHHAEISYCPMCGRDLRGSDHD